MWLRGKSYKKEYEDKINVYIFLFVVYLEYI